MSHGRELPTVKIERYVARNGSDLWRVSYGQRNLLLNDEALSELADKAAQVRNENKNERKRTP